MVWIGRNLKACLVPLPLPLDQVAPCSVQPHLRNLLIAKVSLKLREQLKQSQGWPISAGYPWLYFGSCEKYLRVSVMLLDQPAVELLLRGFPRF